ncbi:MAG: hypothetical protein K6E58_04980 [Eubacterium sp.]|nr:hypothetical protein [Eubacterium sp.]
MKTIIKKSIAVVSAIALVAALFIGVSVTKSAKADSEVALKPWSFFEGGRSGRSTDPDGWPVRLYNSVSTTAGESQGTSYWDVPPDEQYVDGPEITWDSTQPANGFTAEITNTGWDGEYQGSTLVGDNPWLMRAYMTVPAQQAHHYTISFTAKWSNVTPGAHTANVPEKNIMVGAVDEYTNPIFEEGAETRFKVSTGGTYNYSANLVMYAPSPTMKITIAYGAFLYSYKQGTTTEKEAACGKLDISNFKIVDLGEDPVIPTDPPKPTTTQAPTQGPTVAPSPTDAPAPDVTTAAPTVKKTLAKVKGVKVKNTKKKKVKVSWKKVTNAKSYQIKIGNKTYKATKTSKTIKNKKFKKGKKIKVKVRATATGYTTGAWSKTVKKKLTK